MEFRSLTDGPPPLINSDVCDQARRLVRDDHVLSPEHKEHLLSVLTIAPDPTLTAGKIQEFHCQDGNLGGFLLMLREGINFLMTGGRGRPKGGADVDGEVLEEAGINSPRVTEDVRNIETGRPGARRRSHTKYDPYSRNDRGTRRASETQTSQQSRESQSCRATRELPEGESPQPQPVQVSSRNSGSRASQESRAGGSGSRYPSARSPSFQKMRKRPPQLKCEITGDDGAAGDDLKLVAAHIIPVSANSNPKRHHFWKLLTCFWPEHVVNQLRDDRMPLLRNSPKNGLVVRSDVHDAFDALKFFLVPDRGTITDTSYMVKFYWTANRMKIMNYWQTRIVDGEEMWRRFADGDEITFSTHDAHSYPLPDPDLFDIRHVLTRVALSVAGSTVVDDTPKTSSGSRSLYCYSITGSSWSSCASDDGGVGDQSLGGASSKPCEPTDSASQKAWVKSWVSEQKMRHRRLGLDSRAPVDTRAPADTKTPLSIGSRHVSLQPRRASRAGSRTL